MIDGSAPFAQHTHNGRLADFRFDLESKFAELIGDAARRADLHDTPIGVLADVLIIIHRDQAIVVTIESGNNLLASQPDPCLLQLCSHSLGASAIGISRKDDWHRGSGSATSEKAAP